MVSAPILRWPLSRLRRSGDGEGGKPARRRDTVASPPLQLHLITMRCHAFLEQPFDVSARAQEIDAAMGRLLGPVKVRGRSDTVARAGGMIVSPCMTA